MRGWWMRWGCVLLLMVAVTSAPSASGQAQGADELSALNKRISELYSEGKFGEAIPLAERSLTLTRAQKGEEHLDTAARLDWLAGLYKAQGRHAEAEPLYKRSLAVVEKALGPEHPSVGTSLHNLAELYRAQGRYAEAEPLYKRDIAISEKALGPEHPSVGTTLNNLGLVYRAQGRYAETEPLYKRSLALYEKALGPEHPSVGTTLNNLAVLYKLQGRNAEAEPLYKRSLAVVEKALGPEHPSVGTSLNNLAGLYHVQGRYAEAEPLYTRGLAVVEKALGAEHPSVGTTLNNLAALYHVQGRYAEAKPLYERDMAITEKALGPEHPDVGQSLNNLAWLALAQNDLAGAADRWRRATALLQHRAERGLGGATGGTSKGEAQRKRWYFEGLVKTTQRLAAEGRGNAQLLATEMFQTAQWAAGSEAATSLAQMAARSAGGSPALAALVRERQDLVAEWQGKDKLLIAARSEPPTKRNAAEEEALSDRLAAIDARLAAIDARITSDFPDYAALASPKQIAITDVQANLRNDEALVQFLDTDARFKPLPEETFVWVVTKTAVRWVRSDLGTSALKREVAALRCGLDGAAWHGDGAERCADLLKLPPGMALKDGAPLPFDAARAHALYAALFGEVRDVIKGKHLLIVPSGALTTLPFQVLVTEPPHSKDLAAARWLIRDHAITVLPSVASLTALRRTGKASAAPKPMIGFGNPLLDGDQAHPQHGAYFKRQAAIARGQTGCSKSDKKRTGALRAVSRSLDQTLLSSRVVNLDHLRMQSPLPETADELCEVARSIGGSFEDVRIGARATETEVKRLSSSGELAKYRMLHFATHGTLVF